MKSISKARHRSEVQAIELWRLTIRIHVDLRSRTNPSLLVFAEASLLPSRLRIEFNLIVSVSSLREVKIRM